MLLLTDSSSLTVSGLIDGTAFTGGKQNGGLKAAVLLHESAIQTLATFGRGRSGPFEVEDANSTRRPASMRLILSLMIA